MNIERFYKADDIKAAGNCIEIAEHLFGVKVKNERCAAVWRGGTSTDSVHIIKTGWQDHVQKESRGSVIDLAMLKFNGNYYEATQFLGDFYRLTPTTKKKCPSGGTCRYDTLLAEGYVETRRDVYLKADGTPAFFEVRLDHPDPTNHKKQYLLGHGDRWGLGDEVERILFNLPGIKDSPWVCIVEGPKNAQCLIDLGIPATTCVGGAKKWLDSYSAVLSGKEIVIARDNDGPGYEHAEQSAASLYAAKAKSIKVVLTSTAPKGDVYDYIHKEGHSVEDLLALIKSAPLWKSPSIFASSNNGGDNIAPEILADAKQANSEPFRNHIPREIEKTVRGKLVKETVNDPRTHADMLRDLSRRFLGFPRKVGDNFVFDHDRDSGQIMPVPDAECLLAWIGRRSGKPVPWTRGDAMVTPRQFYASISATCPRYEAISATPDWPRRTDIYYTHGKLPDPCPNLSRFNKLISMFLPVTEADELLIRTLFCAPLWYVPGIPRPSWIVDAKGAQGCGKTTLIETVAQLYGSDAISTCKNELEHDEAKLIKRLVSHTGRAARVVLVDNVQGSFNSGTLASLITSRSITGMAPYGHGEETRPNNLTYAITVNTATFSDNDLPSRSFYIFVKKPESESWEKSWKSEIEKYITDYRMEILSDIMSLLSSHSPFYGIRTKTRFPEFEKTILQPCCGTPEKLAMVLESIHSARSDSNTEEDQARAINEVFEFELKNLGVEGPTFIRSEVVNSWGRRAIHESYDYKGIPIQLIRNLCKGAHLPNFDGELRRVEICGGRERYSGIGFKMGDYSADHGTSFNIVGRDASGIITSKPVLVNLSGGQKSTSVTPKSDTQDQPQAEYTAEF